MLGGNVIYVNVIYDKVYLIHVRHQPISLHFSQVSFILLTTLGPQFLHPPSVDFQYKAIIYII